LQLLSDLFSTNDELTRRFGGGFRKGDNIMADDLPELKKEVAGLRRDLDRVLQMLGQETGQPEPLRFLQLEAGDLSIRHSGEKAAIVLQAQQGGAGVHLNDTEGRPRAVIQVDEEGAHFEIWNKQQQVVVSIGETKDGAGEIYVAGADGKPRAGLKVTPVGGAISAQNADGRINTLMIAKGDGGTIVVADADGRPLVEIAATEARGIVAIKQASGAQSAALTGDESGGALTVFDQEGRPRQTSWNNFPP
jgi:hypothetical protein